MILSGSFFHSWNESILFSVAFLLTSNAFFPTSFQSITYTPAY
nr:MAG TPA: hypothetical protein [Caudoviricetes sp.]